MDAEISKATQKILAKQGMKFKLNTKVTMGDDSGENVKISVEAAKGGKEETVRPISTSIIHWTLTPMYSLKQTSSSLPSAVGPIPPALATRPLVSSLTSAAASSSTRSIARNCRIFASLAIAPLDRCWRTRLRRRPLQPSSF